MKPSRHRLAKLLALARRASPRRTESSTPAEVQFFARHTVSEWRHRQEDKVAPDPSALWEKVGNWSLASAAAVFLLITALQPERLAPANPFDAFGPLDADEIILF